jgi:hypothetical protein
MNNFSVEKLKNEITYFFYKNYRDSFYKLKGKNDNRVYKCKVIGSKMNFHDFEYNVKKIVQHIDINNYNNNNDNIVNNVINNIINFNNSYQNYESDYLYIRMKDNTYDHSKFNYNSFKNKYYNLKNYEKPFYLLLYPNYEWADLIISGDH